MWRLAIPFLAAFALAGCGGANQPSSPSTTVTTAAAATTAPAPATTTTAAQGGPSPLTPEAKAAATGDIPDNQVFLTYTNPAGGYSMKYPEGWAQQGSGPQVTIRDKNNIIRIVVASGGPVSSADAKSDVSGVSGAMITAAPQAVTIGGRPGIKVVYTTQSAANAVTGKRVTLIVDRYYLWHGGKRAVVDLGTPQGVDNIDAYRLMIESFRWH